MTGHSQKRPVTDINANAAPATAGISGRRDAVIERINELIAEDQIVEAANVITDLPCDEWQPVLRELTDQAAQVNHTASQHEEMHAMAERLSYLSRIIATGAAVLDPLS